MTSFWKLLMNVTPVPNTPGDIPLQGTKLQGDPASRFGHVTASAAER